MFRLIVLSLAGLSLVASQQCDPKCTDFYRNCNPMGALKSDKNETVDCSQDYFKARCPQFCGLCTLCEFALDSETDALAQSNVELKALAGDLASRIEELENRDWTVTKKTKLGFMKAPVGEDLHGSALVDGDMNTCYASNETGRDWWIGTISPASGVKSVRWFAQQQADMSMFMEFEMIVAGPTMRESECTLSGREPVTDPVAGTWFEYECNQPEPMQYVATRSSHEGTRYQIKGCEVEVTYM